MRSRIIFHIALFCITSCFNHQLYGQVYTPEHTSQNWLNLSNSAEEDMYTSIATLKIAAATMKDTVVAKQLEELGYLAIAQTGFEELKTDKHQRAGVWLLAYPIAIKYGLIINDVIDQRLDLEKSTSAAHQYWNDLKTVYEYDSIADLAFVESPIAIAKFSNDYNSNPGGYSQLVTTKLKLDYVKNLYLKRYSERIVGPLEPTGYVDSDKPISFEAIHHFIQIPTSEIKRLNPQWIGSVYKPSYGNLKLPLKYIDSFESLAVKMEQKTRDDQIVYAAANTKRLAQLKGDIPDLKKYKPIRYKVKMGDNLGRIAQKYHVKISSIRSWNDLSGDRIYAGQKLTIYVSINQKEVVVKTIPKKKKSDLKEGKYKEYTVRTGDTLWGISQQFDDVTADMIMEDNGINENISPGQVLKIRTL